MKVTAPIAFRAIVKPRCRFCGEPIENFAFLENQSSPAYPFVPESIAHLTCVTAFQKGLRAAFRGEEF